MQVPDTEANRKSCICDKGDCPTYNPNALSDTLFCAIGSSPKNPRIARELLSSSALSVDISSSDFSIHIIRLTIQLT